MTQQTYDPNAPHNMLPPEMQQTPEMPPQQYAPPPVPEKPVNPLLAATRMPGITVRLPSKGILYNSGELSEDVVDGEVHVYPMTTLDDITIKSPDKLLSGDAIREVFHRCIPQVQNVDELFARDVDYLMIALRKASYGEEYEVLYDHGCTDEDVNGRVSYFVNVQEFMDRSKELDPTQLQTQFTHTITTNGAEQVVNFKPLRYRDVIKMMQADSDGRDDHSKLMQLFNSMLSVINDVDGVRDPQMIIEWLSTLPVANSKELLDRIENISDWGPDYTHHCQCKHCGEPIELSVPINPVTFFT